MNNIQRKYAKYLNDNKKVSSYSFKTEHIEWQNNFTGEKNVHWCDFKIIWSDGLVEHVDVVCPSDQRPITKYLYAQNHLENWRMITETEWQAIGMPPAKPSFKW